jgi:hypothetical protein
VTSLDSVLCINQDVGKGYVLKNRREHGKTAGEYLKKLTMPVSLDPLEFAM